MSHGWQSRATDEGIRSVGRLCHPWVNLKASRAHSPDPGPDSARSKESSHNHFIRFGLTLLSAATSLLVSGCSSVLETGLYAVSRVKSPVTYDLRHVELNKALSEETRAELDKIRADLPAAATTTNTIGKTDRLDDLRDLAEQDAIVVFCFSGGGSRASRMAMHAMAVLEARYNERFGDSARPLMDSVDVYSSVSGGSIYSSLIAAGFHAAGATNEISARRTGLQELTRNQRADHITRNLGAASALFYLNPAHAGIVPALLATTEWDTLNLFARTHSYLQNNRFLFTPPRKLMTLSDLDPRPRYMFNATCMETKLPFVFTQSAIHTGSGRNPLTGVSYNPARDWFLQRDLAYSQELLHNPLVHATTLEDIGSSPGAFPLSYAVMASAAFPFVFNPLHLKKHNSVNGGRKESHIRLVDGGIYDNTGIVTALELFSHLELIHLKPDRRLILVAINADNEIGSYDEESLAKIGYFEVDIPLRGAYEAVRSLNQVYYHQTQLFRAAIQNRVDQLNRERERIEFFEINIEDVRDEDLRERIQEVKTALIIPQKHDEYVRDAVTDILNSWHIGRRTELGKAIVEAIGEAGVNRRNDEGMTKSE